MNKILSALIRSMLYLIALIYILVFLNIFYKWYPCIIPYSFFDHSTSDLQPTMPYYISTTSAISVIAIWLFITLFLLIKKRNISSSKYRPWLWFMPSSIIYRYGKLLIVRIALSLMVVFFLFSVTIPVTVYLMNGLENPDGAAKEYKVVLDRDILFDEGIIFVAAVTFFGFWTWVNTEYLRKRGEEEVTSLEELSRRIKESLKNTLHSKRKRRCFYYVLDYSIATGHMSDRSAFHEYIGILWELLHNHDVRYIGLTYPIDKLKETYENDYSHYRASDDIKRNKYLIDSRDSFICYIKDKWKRPLNACNGSMADSLNDVDIVYKPLRTEDNDLLLEDDYKDRAYKWGCSTFREEINKYDQLVLDLHKKLCSGVPTSSLEQEKFSLVLETHEVGLIRLIISNDFVAQFVAANDQEKGNRPVGYYSEDLFFIEKYKLAFENYFIKELRKEAKRITDLSNPVNRV